VLARRQIVSGGLSRLIVDGIRRDLDEQLMAKDIHNAAGNGNTKEVARFLKRGVAVDAVDDEGATPLGRAARFGHRDVVELLLSEGADVHHRDAAGRTALHRAAVRGHAELLTLLIDAGAEIDATEDRGETPLMYAALHGYYAAGAVLIKAGADVNAQDKQGYTPLVHSFQIRSGDHGERFELIRLLISSGTDLALRDAEGKTAAELAEEIGHDPELIAILQAASGAAVTTGEWSMIGGPDCVLCRQLKRWKPSKRHPDYIRPDVVEEWLGTELPGRIRNASGTMYRGKRLIKLEILKAWHAELCSEG
jgi:hypothetical protein